MGFLDKFDIKESTFVPYLNTGTMLDIANGKYVPGADGCTILNGGVPQTMGLAGRQQRFKSTEILSFVMNVLGRYEHAEAVVYDTESSLQKDRILSMGDMPVENGNNRLKLISHTEYQTEDFVEFIKKVAEDKRKNAKEYTVQTPILDPVTQEPVSMMIPTLVVIDSWSEMRSKAVTDAMDKVNSSDAGTNMVYMTEGNIKTKVMSQLPRIASRAGIYFFFTVHIGEKYSLDPYAPKNKDLPHMKSSDKLKNAGSDFSFLVSTLLEARDAKVLQSDKKECFYPDVFTNPTEYSRIGNVVCRCKNNGSGTQFSHVVSQSTGIDTNLTNYDYLRTNKFYGLPGNHITHTTTLTPQTSISRTNISKKVREDRRLARALEILSQLCQVQQSWSLKDMPVPLDMTPETLAEKLTAMSNYHIDDILESRGYWSYSKNETRPYLSLFDILAIVDNKYKPKLHKANPDGKAGETSKKQKAT